MTQSKTFCYWNQNKIPTSISISIHIYLQPQGPTRLHFPINEIAETHATMPAILMSVLGVKLKSPCFQLSHPTSPCHEVLNHHVMKKYTQQI